MNTRRRVDLLHDDVSVIKDRDIGYDFFKDYKEEMEQKIIKVEKVQDKQVNIVQQLENWVDIYMPLRLQHQITETIKPTLSSKKAKTLLSKVDMLIVNKLKERVVNDMGDPQLIDRVDEVIKRLELDAKLLNYDDKDKLKRLR